MDRIDSEYTTTYVLCGGREAGGEGRGLRAIMMVLKSLPVSYNVSRGGGARASSHNSSQPVIYKIAVLKARRYFMYLIFIPGIEYSVYPGAGGSLQQ